MASSPKRLLRSDKSKIEDERKQSLGNLELRPRAELDKFKLPSNRQVLERFFRLQLDHSKTTPKKNIAEKLYPELIPFYDKIPCPTKTKINCIKRILSLHEEFRKVQKNVSNYKTNIPDTAYHVFANKLEKLFDLSAPDSEEQIKKDPFRTNKEKIQDIDFLRDQKKDRISKFWAGESPNYKRKVEQKLKRVEREINHENNVRKEQCLIEATANSEDLNTAILIPSDSMNPDDSSSSNNSNSSESSLENTKDKTFSPNNYFSVMKSRDSEKRKKPESRVNENTKKRALFNPLLLTAFDRTKVSDRAAAEILQSAVVASGQDLNKTTVSYASIRRARTKLRKDICSEIKENFVAPERSIVHFDGKLLSDLSGNYGDRLAIMISGNSEQCKSGFCISANLIEDGSGECQSDDIVSSLTDWKALDKIVGMCYDTCSANTGWLNGACVKIESKIGRPLLWLPCRKHVLEIILKAAFVECFGDDLSPVYLEFEVFRCNEWYSLDLKLFVGLEIRRNMRRKTADMIVFCYHHLNREKQLRDDYKECLELVLVVLGSPPENFTFKKPGAYHKARWMAPVIYTLKIYLFRHQLKKTPGEIKQLEFFVNFICFCYIEHWTLCSYASDAPFMDLKLYKDMLSWTRNGTNIGTEVMNKILGHTEYLNQEYICLALFSEKVGNREKQKIAQRLLEIPPQNNYSMGKPNAVPMTRLFAEGMNYELVDFIGNGSLFMFEALGFQKDWLKDPVNEWENSPAFQEMKEFVKHLKTTNDTAERGIKLISDYAQLITKNEDQKQALLQVVQEHRRLHPGQKKSNFINFTDSVIFQV